MILILILVLIMVIHLMKIKRAFRERDSFLRADVVLTFPKTWKSIGECKITTIIISISS